MQRTTSSAVSRWSLVCGLGVGIVAHGCKKEPPTPTSAPARPSTSGSSTTAPSASAADSRPLDLDRAVTDADLAGRTLRELSIMRNFVFARAGQEFRKDWLREYFGQYPWYHPSKTPAEVSQLGRDNAEKIASYDAALPSDELRRRADLVLGRVKAGSAEPNDAVELRLLSERLGQWLVPSSEKVRPSPLENPSLLDRVLALDDLGNLSRRDLRILRNTVYARKGRDFASEGLREYFASKAWYSPVTDYTDHLLSSVDWKNIKLISSVEDTLGGPLSDGDHFGRKYGWFGGA